ncbi:hypothetical protein TBLA_0A00600 [Henningerozyma blattae CBS 6284]|uniref:Geranylgeranyl pyrophosphate synthase n=1 Tax=Henningerozyma blattae (strain ATCC 34711 / CBS 6284 / DSM 70876 / NBRC 10599 / NRRL Y-10934 / UCD 77-7) TaxID=1071380 RepID=I2GUQ9_HENB6|nr:hypothetical protein TBLA_0A00600 [Tetrapisispora blattae CBS 6284]CCH57861.1 hypothetical protein TBLA_0A00600 [Tetrapisispora blattae CBS 6284]
MENIKRLVENKPCWKDSDETAIRAPYTHLALKPGKNFRSELIRLFNLFYGLSQDQVTKIEQLVSILHNSSLLIDDIEDSSETRRGDVSSYIKFGIPMTINSANYMYFAAMQVLQDIAEFKHHDNHVDVHLLKDLMVIFNEEMLNLHRGQGLDIFWRENIPDIIPDESMYFNMVMNKTGGLFRLTVRIMERLCKDLKYRNGECTLVPLSNLLGILYQLRDDYQNLTDPKMFAAKGFADDISEGKLSFPIIHGLKYESMLNITNNTDNTPLLDMILKKPMEKEKKLEVISYLRDISRSLEYTEHEIMKLTGIIKNNGYIPSDNEKLTSQILLVVDKLSNISY